MEDTRHETKNDDPEIDLITPNVIKRSKDLIDALSAMKDLTSDPFKRAIDEKVQRSIIENIENTFYNKQEQKETRSHKEDIQIHDKLSPGDIYILRIVGNCLEVVENHNGDAIYRRLTLA